MTVLFSGLKLRLPLLAAAWTCMTLLASSILAPPVHADDSWNPFAEKDRRRSEQAAQRRAPETRPSGNDQRPYLAPMSPDDISRSSSGTSQPYPAATPQYRSGYPAGGPGQPPTQPNGQIGIAPATDVGVPYGAPGTYVPPQSSGGQSAGAAQPTIERGELTPVISTGNAPSNGAWQGLNAAGAEQLLGPVQLPPASPALNDLLTRVLAEPVSDARLKAVISAAFLKAGRFDAAYRLQAQSGNSPPSPDDATHDVLISRMELVTGNQERACTTVKRAVAAQDKLPKHLRGEAIVMAGYCAIVAGNRQAGSLAAELARDSGYKQAFTLAILEAIASGENIRTPLPRVVTALDGLLAQHLTRPDPALMDSMLERADAGLLQLVATDTRGPALLRLKAAEQAAAANIATPSALADAYRSAAEINTAGGSEISSSLERARQFATAERQQAQFAKTRAIRALLDSAARDHLYHAAAVAVAPVVRAMRPAPEISWFAETAIETLAAGGDYRAAREWVHSATPTTNPGGTLDHWLMLLDIADPEVNSQNRGRSITELENLAVQGRFSQPALHRLATVLDALDYNVPIPLWNLASRTQQPQTGHLPQTGVLSAMKQASEAHQIAATTLYALNTIAPSGTTSTHLLGLGETIRALKRAGLEKDARRLGFEALFADWPRTRR